VKPMKILRFPVRQSPVRDIAGRIASLETLLSECMSRQSRFHEDRRRLSESLDRLAVLARNMARDSESLKRSAGRLRRCRPRIAPKSPPV